MNQLCVKQDYRHRHPTRFGGETLGRFQRLPVDSPRALLRLDVDVIVVDVDLGDLHLEVVGQQADGLPHGAQSGPTRGLEKGGGGRGAWGGRHRAQINQPHENH